MIVVEQLPQPPVLPPARHGSVRLHLLARAAGIMLTSLTGVVLFCLWVTAVAISPLTVVAPLLIPVTALVRSYAGAHRRAAQRLLGTPIDAGYRPTAPSGVIGRVWSIVRDPASWRDAWWCVTHAVIACVTATLQIALFAGGVLYLIYPFLYWVTPQRVFGEPFGGALTLHSVGDATIMMPLALVAFGLWYLLALPLTRAELALTRALLGGGAARGV